MQDKIDKFFVPFLFTMSIFFFIGPDIMWLIKSSESYLDFMAKPEVRSITQTAFTSFILASLITVNRKIRELKDTIESKQ